MTVTVDCQNIGLYRQSHKQSGVQLALALSSWCLQSPRLPSHGAFSCQGKKVIKGTEWRGFTLSFAYCLDPEQSDWHLSEDKCCICEFKKKKII